MKLTKQMLHEMIEEVMQEGKKPGESNAEYHARMMANITDPEKRYKKKSKRPTDTTSPFRDRGAAGATDKLNPVKDVQEADDSGKDKKYWRDMLERWASEPTEEEQPTNPAMPFRDRDDYEASQRLNPDVSDPYQQGAAAGKAAGLALIKSDSGKMIKNADPIHWETINAATDGQSDEYRLGFEMGYGEHWGSITPSRETPEEWGTDTSLTGPMADLFSGKPSPSPTRKPNKWEL
jgi:hypothetical protein